MDEHPLSSLFDVHAGRLCSHWLVPAFFVLYYSQALQAVSQYETAAELWPAYVRGLAYLRKGAGAEAAAEFQKFLDHRGMSHWSPFYPLAHLGLARAAAISGDVATARKAYQDFFALGKDADPDIRPLQEARQEYEKLK